MAFFFKCTFFPAFKVSHFYQYWEHVSGRVAVRNSSTCQSLSMSLLSGSVAKKAEGDFEKESRPLSSQHLDEEPGAEGVRCASYCRLQDICSPLSGNPLTEAGRKVRDRDYKGEGRKRRQMEKMTEGEEVLCESHLDKWLSHTGVHLTYEQPDGHIPERAVGS